MPLCLVCKKNQKRIATHHIIPRFLSISSDDDTMECCISCHRKFDIKFKNLILWGTLNPPKWNNIQKERESQRRYREKNRDLINRRNRERGMKKRRAMGLHVRGSDIKDRYEDIEVFKKELHTLYWDKKLSWREVAKAMKLSRSCVDNWRRKLKVPTRTQAESTRIWNKHKRE